MIIVKLKGGHSNQMFQYATGRSLAAHWKTKLMLDLSWYDNLQGVESPRHYELGGYNIVEKFYAGSLLHRIEHKLGIIKRYEEVSHAYDPELVRMGGSLHIDGYFQSEKYFFNIRETLLQDFTYKEPPNAANQALLKDIASNPNAVSVHVRRGDYVTGAATSKFHGLKDADYYKEALRIIKKSVKNPTLYIISNDPEWCRKHMRLGEETIVVDANNDDTGGADDMRLMRACKHNICANSSFSWWGAWLNENPQKIVVAPKKWFNDPAVDTKDIIPETWIKI